MKTLIRTAAVGGAIACVLVFIAHVKAVVRSPSIGHTLFQLLFLGLYAAVLFGLIGVFRLKPHSRGFALPFVATAAVLQFLSGLLVATWSFGIGTMLRMPNPYGIADIMRIWAEAMLLVFCFVVLRLRSTRAIFEEIKGSQNLRFQGSLTPRRGSAP